MSDDYGTWRAYWCNTRWFDDYLFDIPCYTFPAPRAQRQQEPFRKRTEFRNSGGWELLSCPASEQWRKHVVHLLLQSKQEHDAMYRALWPAQDHQRYNFISYQFLYTSIDNKKIGGWNEILSPSQLLVKLILTLKLRTFNEFYDLLESVPWWVGTLLRLLLVEIPSPLLL